MGGELFQPRKSQSIFFIKLTYGCRVGSAAQHYVSHLNARGQEFENPMFGFRYSLPGLDCDSDVLENSSPLRALRVGHPLRGARVPYPNDVG